MLTDGIKSQNLEDQVKQVDVAELLERACSVREQPALPAEALLAGGVPTEAPAEVVAQPGE
jgi:hypothetical protein